MSGEAAGFRNDTSAAGGESRPRRTRPENASPDLPERRRYRIVHTTDLGYAGTVQASHSELRMTPGNEPGQLTLENRIRVRPMTWSHLYRDSFGTHVMTIEATTEHTSLTVEASSTVELSRRAPAGDAFAIGWDELLAPARQDRHVEWLLPTPRTAIGPDLGELVAQARSVAPLATAYAVSELIRSSVAYEPGATEATSSGADAWAARRGVCQDFAHLMCGAMRSLRVPARYVSGYLVPRSDIEVGETLTGESHAWVEVWLGGWLQIDPTNGSPVALDHVVVGRGRDYGDVPPLKGVYSGPQSTRNEVEVCFTRLA